MGYKRKRGPQPEPEPEPELFLPEYIVGIRVRKDGVTEYKIKWKGTTGTCVAHGLCAWLRSNVLSAAAYAPYPCDRLEMLMHCRAHHTKRPMHNPFRRCLSWQATQTVHRHGRPRRACTRASRTLAMPITFRCVAALVFATAAYYDGFMCLLRHAPSSHSIYSAGLGLTVRGGLVSVRHSQNGGRGVCWHILSLTVRNLVSFFHHYRCL